MSIFCFRKVFFPNLSRSGLNDNACVRFVSAANVHFQGCRAPLSDSSFGPHCMRTTSSCKVSFPRRRGLVCLGNKFSTRHSISPVTDERALAQACGDFSLLLCACVCVPPSLRVPPSPPRLPPPPDPVRVWSCAVLACVQPFGRNLLWDVYMSVPRSVSAALLGLVYSHIGLGVSTGLLC